MTAETLEPRKVNRRRKLCVDPLLHGRAVFSIVGIAAAFVLVWVASSFWGRSPDDQLSSDDAANLRLLVEISFVLIGVVALAIYVLWVLHRFVGPARVIRHALAGMAEGDFGRRLKLRKDDFLKDVAAAAATVAQRMQADRQRSAEFVAALDRALEQGDVEAARAALLVFRAPHAAVVEAVDAVAPAPSPAPVAAAKPVTAR